MDLESRAALRASRRRAVRRRRLTAIATIALAGCAIVAIALAAGGSSSGRPGAAPRDAARQRAVGTPGVARATGPPGTEPVPILMYHVIAPPPAGAPFPGLYVPPEEFAAQMHALKRSGWHAVTLDEVESYWHHGVELGPGRPIVVSFDNGYNSQYTQALPVLRGLGWVAVENLQLSGLPPSQGGLGEGQIQGLLAAGWELDTQGYSHADLVTLDAEELHFQVAVARATLRRRYHVPVNWFCYPSGHYDASVIAAVKTAGFLGSTTVIPGWAHPSEDPYRLPRLRVLGGTSPQELLAQLASIRENPPAPASYGS